MILELRKSSGKAWVNDGVCIPPLVSSLCSCGGSRYCRALGDIHFLSKRAAASPLDDASLLFVRPPEA